MDEARRGEIVAELHDESTITYTIYPSPGEMLTAETVGESIIHLARGLRASGKAIRVPTEVLVRDIQTDAAGTITIRLMAIRFELPGERRERIDAARAAARPTPTQETPDAG